MREKSLSGLLLTAACSFVGGFALGLLLSPKSGRENRAWISENAEDMGHWIDSKSRQIIHLTEEQVNQIAARIQETLDANLPDLYKATERISINDEPDTPSNDTKE